MKLVRIALATMLTAVSLPASAAVTINFAASSAAPTPGTTVFDDFNSLGAGSTIGSNAYVFSNSIGGTALRPAYGSLGNFGAVLAGGSATFMFNPSAIFAFTLGSLDAYNSLTLLFADGTSQTYNGGQIVSGLGAGTGVTGPGSGQVSYTVDGGSLIKGVTFNSASNSFEFDNLASRNGAVVGVPEPAVWGLMILGLGLIGARMRRRPKTSVSYN